MSSSAAPNELRLLVVEDDDALRDEIVRVLEKRTGYDFDTAPDAETAIGIFRDNPHDLVITDVRMPGMSGIDMLEILKELKPEIVSVIITAFADEQATIKALKIGANDYIRKPFSIRDLLAAIERQVTLINLRAENLRQQNFFRGMVENLISGVIAFDNGGNLTAANARAAEAMGIAVEELVELESRDEIKMLQSPAARALIRLLDELESSGADHLERDQTMVISGLEIPYRLSAMTLYGEERRRLGTVVLFNDISTVVQQQKLSAWKDLARTVAHEIKNPLTPILLGAQQLKSARELGEEALMNQFDIAVETILKNARRLDSLAREFSRFGRLPHGKRSRLALGSLVQTAMDHFKERMRQEDIRATFTNKTERDVIHGDSEGLLRMLENLLANACDAMPAGGEVAVSLEEDEPGWLKLEISDTGEGIAEEVRDSLFKPYVTSKEGGTGLGLVVVRDVIDRHDGTIEVESVPGEGTTFSLRLPLHTPEE